MFMMLFFVSLTSLIKCREPNEPIISINTDLSQNETFKDILPSNVFIQQALSYILTGDYGGEPIDLNNDRFDETDLGAVLAGIPLILVAEAEKIYGNDIPENVISK
jgi:hypothetical protein